MRYSLLSLACVTLVNSASAQLPSQNVRDLLPDVSARDLSTLGEAESFNPEDAIVDRVLRRCDRIALSIFVELGTTPLPTNQMTAAKPGSLYQIAGSVVTTKTIEPRLNSPPSPDEPSSDSHPYYLTEIATEQSPILVVTCEIPNGLLSTDDVNRRCRARGFFLAMVHWNDHSVPLMATRRMEWLPVSATSEVKPGLARLGAAGFDVGLLELAPKHNGQSLDHEDTLAVLQLLHIVDQATSKLPDTEPTVDIVDLLQNPTRRSGQLYQVDGVVDRVTKIELGDNNLARHLDLDHYYQLDMHVPIGNRRLNVASGRSDENLSFDNEYPLTLLAKSLPGGLNVGRRQNVQIHTSAFLYRMWSFASVKSRRIDPKLKQVVPLMVGGPIQLITLSNRTFSMWTAAIAVGGVAGLVLFAMLFGRSPTRRRGKADANRLPDQLDLSGLPTSRP